MPDDAKCREVAPIQQRIESLRRAVQFGLTNNKRNMIVELDVLAALLSLGETLYCEHGIKDGDWCPVCNTEYKRARAEAAPTPGGAAGGEG